MGSVETHDGPTSILASGMSPYTIEQGETQPSESRRREVHRMHCTQKRRPRLVARTVSAEFKTDGYLDLVIRPFDSPLYTILHSSLHGGRSSFF